MWFADPSVLLAAQDSDDAEHLAAGRLLGGHAPVGTLDLVWYEVTNVAVRAWRDEAAARRLSRIVGAIAQDGGLVRVDDALIAATTAIAIEHGLSTYDAAYVAGARAAGADLVSCDVSGLVSRGLAVMPSQAV
jgi:predicted nucleic acid-binding protein